MGSHFYIFNDGNPRRRSSTTAGDTASPNDELFFQNSDNNIGQQRRDADDFYGSASQVSRLSPTPPQTMFGFPPIRIQSDMLLLVQHPYQSGLPLEHLRTVLAIHYGWVNLQAVFSDDFGDLLDSDQLAWADDIQVPPKLAVVFRFPGYPMYKRQVTVLRAHNQPPTRGAMARILAREMSKFLDKARTEYRRPLRWHGWELTLSDLFLIDIKQVSRGSLQPRIGIRGNMGRPGSGLAPRMNMTFAVPNTTY
ncbi:hypothetical protein V8D89_014668 [Ganoderma adspersum]